MLVVLVVLLLLVALEVLVEDDIAGWLVSLCTCELGQPGGGREFSVLVTTSL